MTGFKFLSCIRLLYLYFRKLCFEDGRLKIFPKDELQRNVPLGVFYPRFTKKLHHVCMPSITGFKKVCFTSYNWTSVKIDKNVEILNIHTDILCILSAAVLCWWLLEELSSEQPMLLQTSPCIFSQSSLQPVFVWSTPSSDAVSTVHINMRNYQSIYIPVYLHSENKVQKLSLGC